VGRQILIQDENQTEAIGHLLGFTEAPTPEWAIQRPDGAYWTGSHRTDAGRVFDFGAEPSLTFISRDGAQLYIDSMQRSTLYRKPFTDCTPVEVLVIK
jgi:hypothetical protein